MYTKHHTEGIILKTFDVGEADRRYVVLTRDLGTISTHARGVRNLSSKLRYGLQELSHADFSLVCAKSGWRITSATPKKLFHDVCTRDAHSAVIVRRVLGLVRHLVQGEEINTGLFDIVYAGLSYLCRHNLNEVDCARLETVLVLRVLHTLGYLGGGERFSYVLASAHVSDLHLADVARIGNSAVYEINRSLKETQM